MHARSDVRLTAVVLGDQLEVEVFDDDSRVPLRQVRDAGALGGRGLALLDAISDEWGTRPQPVGTSIWLHLRLRPPSWSNRPSATEHERPYCSSAVAGSGAGHLPVPGATLPPWTEQPPGW